ncbi:putative HTH-type transcriptional regulator YdfH [Pigmentiphaga humi]|uniref:Putative HTH-type transcriptional regulator YdfH n=1 Tax=Pigmentiphaga humi TaxID=2478468 RepID=A0A3P4AWG6_9BURK|nr:GntR family transcriptional regulator [Pigmentiphaga humi]VCU68399.1 putative HTH-type transcriptional regulator YdfH [Pigmentiphaga humi]
MTTIAARISQSLADEIMSGLLAPGARLEEPTLAERFQVSRTPIREALRLLNARGLIELVPRRGGVVASVSAEQLADMLEAMCELESLCCRIATQRMSAMQRRQLELLHEEAEEVAARGDTEAYLALNARFHQLLCEGAQNQTLVATVENLRERLSPVRAAQGGVERRFEVSHREHQKIVEAVLAGQPEQAYLAMRSHTTRLTLHVMELIEAQRAASA